MKIATKTDKGLLRSTNQDSFAAGEINGRVFAVICDGMGGAKGGGVASANAVKIISGTIDQSLNHGADPAYIRAMLQSAMETANAMVYDMAQKNEAFSGMGTTAVSVVVTDGIAYIAHAGDSRAYLCSDNTLTQLTVDHSIVQSMVENGQLTADEAKTHPRKNVITRAIGVDDNIDADQGECKVKQGDLLLLCTDGLTNYADQNSILKVLTESAFDSIPERLIELANKGGGGDNITVIVIGI